MALESGFGPVTRCFSPRDAVTDPGWHRSGETGHGRLSIDWTIERQLGKLKSEGSGAHQRCFGDHLNVSVCGNKLGLFPLNRAVKSCNSGSSTRRQSTLKMLLWTELLLDGGMVPRNIKKQRDWWTREENVVMGGVCV